MLKYELDVAGAGLAEERRGSCGGVVFLKRRRMIRDVGVVILKMGAVEGRMVVGIWVRSGSQCSDRG